MTLWWIGNAILLVAVLPVVIYLLNRVLAALERIRRSGRQHPGRRGGPHRRARTACPTALATTDETVKEVSVGAVRYAGSVAKLLG